MIRSLRIRDLATIEDLELRLAPGFTVLTGETGAGKSVLMDAVRLLAGDRASSGLVRTGAAEASIEGVFQVPAAGLPDDIPPGDGGELLVQRRISDQGAGKAWVNGVLTPVRRLRELGPLLVDVYGQNDHVFLLRLESHLEFVDAFGGTAALREETRRAARELKALVERRRELESRRMERERRLDFLRFQIAEIETAGLRADEEDELRRERELLRNAEKISRTAAEALDLCLDQEDSILPRLARFEALADDLGRFAPALAAVTPPLGDARIALQEAAALLADLRDRQAGGPEDLERIEARLDILDRLKRKYGPAAADVIRHLDLCRDEERVLARGEEERAGLDDACARAFALYADRAGELSRLRRTGAAELERLVEKEIALLGMRKARFAARFETAALDPAGPGDARENGIDEVEFLISPNPGEDLRPLRRIASGGELSRIMLALKSVGRDPAASATLVFDEVDAGIGGRTADAVARRLAALAARQQVICITHLPQIASSAAHHVHVEKTVAKDRTYTRVRSLDFEGRVEEIARLLAGRRITASSLDAARDMLQHNVPAAAGGRPPRDPEARP